MLADAALILGAYLLGSFQHLPLLARLRHVELDGDYHQNLWYRAGRAVGVIGVIGELAKGAIPVLVGKGLDFPLSIVAAAGLAAVCGQMWPVFARFDGEKGNSIAIAMVLALVPKAAAVAVVAVIISLVIRTGARLTSKSGDAADKAIIGGSYSRSLPIGMLICFFSLPFLCRGFGEPPEIVWCCAALFVLIMVRRLTAGLRNDLKTGSDTGRIVLNRLLYDRAAIDWRG